jgi:hypothetical protein
MPEVYQPDSPLRIYLSESGGLPDKEYDFYLTREKAISVPEYKNLILPPVDTHGKTADLAREDYLKLFDLLGEPASGHAAPTESHIAVGDDADSTKKLTIGMATYDDYDGVYFTVQAIRMFHPEVTDETEILVIDNHPAGPCAKPLKDLSNHIPGYRYLAVEDIRGTAVRDFVFHEANTEYVMCIDSHVFIVPGALRKLIDYFDSNPDTADLLQGPLIGDNLRDIRTHFEPAWRKGMYGFWSCDKRGLDADAEPFDIPMQGLGLAACRKAAWLGYNPRFMGFGGEEGYIHQKFRNAGARTLCLPFLRWMHRFNRPLGTPYRNKWEDRIRNYLIGFEEVGLDTELLEKHFRDITSDTVVNSVIEKLNLEKNNPFNFFDAIYCINLDTQQGRWNDMQRRLDRLGILDRVKRFSAIHTPESHHIGCALSHRKIIELASKMGYENILVLEDDALFHRDTIKHLGAALPELSVIDWKAFYLGGMKWGEKRGSRYVNLPGCKYLQKPELLTCTHAIAYHRRFYDELLDELPADVAGMQQWVEDKKAIDQYLTKVSDTVVMNPVVASQPNILNDEDESMKNDFF